MACGSCGRSRGSTRSVSPAASARTIYGAEPMARSQTRSLAPADEGYVRVRYNGPHGNHYITSPTKKVRHYGYGGNGLELSVHPEDAARRPDLFQLIEVEPVAAQDEPIIGTAVSEGAVETGVVATVQPGGELTTKLIVPEDKVDRKDVLTEVDGVGPAREEKLNEAGIITYEALAALTQEELAEILGSSETVAASILKSAKKLV